MNKFLSICLAIGLAVIFVGGCRPTDSAWETVSRRGVLRVGLDPTFPPFENADTGELRGIDVDLARAVGETLGVEVEFVFFGFDGLYDALATEQVDVLISALVIDVSRTRDFTYSEPYFNAGQYLFIHAEGQDPREAGLAAWTLAVELGAEGHVQAIEWSRRYPEMTILPLPTANDALWVVVQQEAAGALVDQISGRLYQRDFPQLQIVTDPVTVEPYAIVTRVDDQSLLGKINDALLVLESQGEIDRIVDRWISAENPP